MNQFKLPSPSNHWIGLLVVSAAVACTGSTTTNSPAPSNPNPPAGDEVVSLREALDFVAPCSAATCGAVPATAKATRPECIRAAGSCGWTDPSPDDAVSYRPCAESECGTKPDPSVCPTTTTYKGSQCGSENEGACVWRTACTAPPSTKACATENGCGPKPELGVLCKDGSIGDLACMNQGAKCGWERTCE